ncbi:hypothetical protein P7H19_11745 [Paenibacillus larvae]|nr:hypothetical protein [Paenibacillus larvae]MDT2236833.1 hypothetical protein [Paenibacillus larvae]
MISGASRGLGRALTLAFAAKGAKLAIAAGGEGISTCGMNRRLALFYEVY